MHIDDAPPADELRPSELIAAIKLMKQSMRLDKHDRFAINPVRTKKHLLSLPSRRTTPKLTNALVLLPQIYVYSFSAYKARILETYYDAGQLFVRKTPYVDFAEENRENIKLYLRWMLNDPSGLTAFAERNGEDSVSDEPSDTESTVVPR